MLAIELELIPGNCCFIKEKKKRIPQTFTPNTPPLRYSCQVLHPENSPLCQHQCYICVRSQPKTPSCNARVSLQSNPICQSSIPNTKTPGRGISSNYPPAVNPHSRRPLEKVKRSKVRPVYPPFIRETRKIIHLFDRNRRHMPSG